MNEGLWVGDMKNKSIYANPAFLEMVGYTMDELFGKDAMMVCAPEHEQILNEQMELRRKYKESHYEITFISKKGERIPVLIHAVPFVEGSLATITDLRAIKRMEKSEKEFQTFAKYSIDAMVSLDEKDTVKAWNVGAERMFGWSAEEIVGKNISCVIPKEKIESGEVEYLFKEAKEKGFVRNYETIRLHKSGAPINVSITYTVLNDSKGKNLGYSAVYRDVTIQKQWEKDLQKRFDKMQEAYSEMGKLRRYVDYLVDLLDMGTGASKGREIIQFIVNAILMFSKVDAVIFRKYDDQKKSLILAGTAGATTDWQAKGNLLLRESLAEEAFLTKHPIKILDITQENRYKTAGLARKNNLRSLLLIPLFIDSEKIGTISIYISAEKSLDLLDHEFIPIFAKQAGIVLRLSQLTQK